MSYVRNQPILRWAVLTSLFVSLLVLTGCQTASMSVPEESISMEVVAEEDNSEVAPTQNILAAIVPHHLVAESIIDSVISEVAQSQPELIILVSPDHWGSTQTKFTTTAQAEYIGVPVATTLRDQLLQTLPSDMFGTDDESLAREHGLFNIVPFIKTYLPNAQILPVSIAQSASQDQISEFIEELKLTGVEFPGTQGTTFNDTYNDVTGGKTINGKTIAVIASVDFSHYLPFEAAELHDVKTRRILSQFVQEDVTEDLSSDLAQEISQVEVDCWQCLYLVSNVAQNYALPFTELRHDNAAGIEHVIDTADETTSYVGAMYESGRQPTKYNHTSMLVVGDSMLGRYVETLMDTRGVDYPFAGIEQFFRGMDMVIGNLEGPISEPHIHTPNGEMRFSFRDEFADVLRRYGFTDMSLANNHLYDQGVANFTRTGQVLAASGINSFGHPTEETREYVMHKAVNGQPMTLIGLNAFGSQFSREAALETVRAASADNSRFTMVYMHWGVEYSLHSNVFQQQLAHDMIDAGADIIIGAHPHVVQEVEVYNNVPIFYSLGNFIFDQYFSQDTQEELAVGIELSDNELVVRLFPLRSVNSQPELMPLSQARPWLEDLAARSTPELEDAIKSGIMNVARNK